MPRVGFSNGEFGERSVRCSAVRSHATFVGLLTVALGACVPTEECRSTTCVLVRPGEGYEFIVVGSGAGGGPLAARLARAGRRVLLLEAGQDVGDKLHYQVPAMHALSTEDPSMAWWFFVRHHADEAQDALDTKHRPEGVLYPRGSALGGSTAVNAMVTVLPGASDWNAIAARTGDGSWRAEHMDPYYDRVREWLSVEVPDPGLAIGDRKISTFLSAAALTHAAQDGVATGAELNRLLEQDVNAALRTGEATGLFRLPLATRAGQRSGTREWIKATVDQGFPLTVKTGSFVTKILWDTSGDRPRAIGVDVAPKNNIYGASLSPEQAPLERLQYYATSEVILAAGAFNSPQILQLSGVGDPSELAGLGIDVRVPRPGVGRNLQDRYEGSVVSQFSSDVALVQPCHLGEEAGDPCLDQWRGGRGVYQTSGFLATVLRRSLPGVAQPDLQIFAVPGDARGYYPNYASDSLAVKNRFTWLLLKAHTQNRDGSVRLKSKSPFERPAIAFNYFDERDPLSDPDLLAMVEGIKFIRRIEAKAQELLEEDRLEEIWPGLLAQTDQEIAAWIRKEAWGHHACCSDRIGAEDDGDAVLDPRFRVIGAERLRVVDASVFPEIPGTFIALPTYMMSEKAADVILEDNP